MVEQSFQPKVCQLNNPVFQMSSEQIVEQGREAIRSAEAKIAKLNSMFPEMVEKDNGPISSYPGSLESINKAINDPQQRIVILSYPNGRASVHRINQNLQSHGHGDFKFDLT